MTRKEAKAILNGMGITNRFSLKTVNFCRSSKQVLTVKDWTPDPKAGEIKAAFTGIIVEFDPGVAFAS